MLETIAKILIAPILFVMSLAGYGVVDKNETPLGATLPIAGQTYTLSGSGVSSSATSITLSSFTIPQTGYKILDADMSTTFYLTLEPGNRTRQEIVSCTTVTQNANDTATLSGCVRGLMPISPYTESSSYKFAHAGGSSVVFSNPPQFYNQFLAADNTGTITGQYTFSTSPIVPTVISASTTNAASIGYVNGVVLAGGLDAATTVKGVSKLSVAPASSTDPIAVGDNDNRVSPVSLATVTAGQIASLASSTSMSATNTVITLADTATTTSASKIVKTNTSGKISSTFTLNSIFGGTGADGALSTSSGTMTINCGGLNVCVKNYTSISITGTAKLAFSNPHASGTIVILKSQGDVTITSNSASVIDLTGMGSAAATPSYGTLFYNQAAGASSGATGGAGGVSGIHAYDINSRTISIVSGAGGGAGAVGAGGRGAGSLYIECAGAYNFTTGTMVATGSVGGAGQGGGGGGGAGMFIILYNTLTADSGTYTATGGAGGAATAAGGAGGTILVGGLGIGNGGSGAGGSSSNYAGGGGGAGTGGTSGANGGSGGVPTDGSGGGGGGGMKVIQQNTLLI